MRVGLDYRPALVNREGIGRAVREAVRAHGAAPAGPMPAALELALFGATLAGARFAGPELGLGPRARLFRRRLPSRLWRPLFRATGLGADRVLGGVDLFHHTQPATLPIARALETATVWDTLWKDGGSGWIAPEVAAGMEASARARVERCARLQVPSRHAAAELVAVLGADPERIDLVPLGCDHVLRVAPDARRVPERPFLLTAARVDPRKNHAGVLAALERLVARGRDLVWVVVGPPGHAAERFGSALAASPVRARVQWRRHVPDAELVALYRACACFVFPSLGEGFGLPPLEAAALGAPVVSSDRGALAEVLPPHAHRIDPDDVDGLADAIAAALDGPRPASTTGPYTWAASAAAQHRSWERALAEHGTQDTGP